MSTLENVSVVILTICGTVTVVVITALIAWGVFRLVAGDWRDTP